MGIKITHELLKDLSNQMDQGKPVLPQLFERFVPALFGVGVVRRNSLQGRISCLWNQKGRRQDQLFKVGEAFARAMESLNKNLGARSQVSQGFRTALFQALKDKHHLQLNGENQLQIISSNSDLDKLQPILENNEAMRIKIAEQQRATSLLRGSRDKSNDTLSDEEFSQVIDDELSSKSLDVLERFLKRNPHHTCPQWQEKISVLRQGIAFRAQLQAEMGKGKPEPSQEKQQIKLNALTDMVHGEVAKLKAGERWMFCGNYGRKVDSITRLFSLMKGLPEGITSQIPSGIADLLKEDSLPDPLSFIEENLREGIEQLKIMIPNLDEIFNNDLFTSLLDDQGRQIPGKVKEWIPKFLEKPLDNLFQEGILKQLQVLVPEGSFRDLLGWLSENSQWIRDPQKREAFLQKNQKKISDLLCNPINNATKEMDQLVGGLFKNIQNMFPPELAQMTGLDDKISSGEFWVEFEKQQDGRFTLLIHASGQALSYHPKDAENKRVQWPLRFTDVVPEKLDQFCQRLVFHTFAPQIDPSAISSPTDIYEGLLEYLNSPTRYLPEDSHFLPPLQMGSLSMAQLMLSNSNTHLDLASAHFQREAFLVYCRPYQKGQGSEQNLVLNDTANVALLERATKKLCEDAETLGVRIGSPMRESIRAAREDVQEAIVKMRPIAEPKTPQQGNADLGIPPAMIAKMQEFMSVQGISIENIRSSKSILCWALGDEEIGNVIDAIADGVSPAVSKVVSSDQPIEVASVNLPYKKGWLLTILTSFYLQTALKALKYAVLIGSVYSLRGSPTSIALMALSSNWVLQRVIPKQIYDWYTEVLSILQAAIQEVVFSIILRCLFSLDGAQELLLFAKQWQKVAKAWTDIAMGKEVMSYQLDSIDQQHPLPALTLSPATFSVDGSLKNIRSSEIHRSLLYVNSKPSTPEELTSLLEKCSKDIPQWSAETMPVDALSPFLNAIETLEIPKIGRNTLWDQVAPVETMMLIKPLLFGLTESIAYLAIHNDCPELNCRSYIAVFSLLTITDRLARRCPEAHLEGYTTNAYQLLSFVKGVGPRIESPHLNERLREVCDYLLPGIDIDHLPEDLSKDKELAKKRQESLFDYSGFSAGNSYSLPEIRYLKERLQMPEVVQRLKDMGMPESASEEDKIYFLANESFDVRPDSLIPYAFCLLKMNALYANSLMQDSSFNRPIYDFYCGNGFRRSFPDEHSWIRRVDRMLGKPLQIKLLDLLPYNSLRYFSPVYDSLYNYRLMRHRKELPLENRCYNFSSRNNKLINFIHNSYRNNENDQSHVYLHQSRLDPEILEYFSSTEELQQFRLIFSEKTDGIMRLVQYMSKYKKDCIANVEKAFLLEDILFGIGNLKKQLKESPMVAKTLGIFFQEFFDFHADRANIDHCLWIIRRGIKVKRFCEHYAPESVSDFPDFRKMLNSLAEGISPDSPNVSKNKQDISMLYALAYPAEKESLTEPEKLEAVQALIKANFSRNDTDYDYRSNRKEHIGVNITTEFNERYSLWKKEILAFLKDPEKRKILVNSALDSQQIHLQNREQIIWRTSDDWAFHHENIIIDFYLGTVSEKKQFINQSFLKLLRDQVASRTGLRVDDLKTLGNGIFETPDHTVRVETDAKGYFVCMRMIEGKKFLFVEPSETEQEMCKKYFPIGEVKYCWMEVTDQPRKIVQIESLSEIYRFTVVHSVENPNEFSLYAIHADGEEHPLINSEAVSSLLRPINRFCPSSEMTCFATPDKSRLESIQLNPYGLQFKVKNVGGSLQAVNQDQFSGYSIAPQQIHPALRGIGSYLILEKGPKDRKVLITKSQWISPLLSQFLNKVGLGGPLAHLAEKFIENVQKDIIGANSSGKFYAYDISPSGGLQSEDPEALIYMILNYLLQGKDVLAAETCDALELLFKQKSIKISSTCLLPLLFIPPGNERGLFIRKRIFAMMEENRLIRKRVFAMMEENRLLFPTESDPKGVEEGLKNAECYFDLIYGGMILSDLLNKGSTKQTALTDSQEWFLFKSAFHHFSKCLRSSGVNLGYLNNIEGDTVMEFCSFPPELIQRYQRLKIKYGNCDDSLLNKGLRLTSRFINAPSGIPALPSLLVPQTELSNEFRDLIRVGVSSLSRMDHTNLKDEIAPDRKKDPPLNIRNLTATSFKFYYLEYYAIAKGEGTAEQKEKLREMLSLIKGGWDSETQALIGYLDAVITFPRLFWSVKKFERVVRETTIRDENGVPLRWTPFSDFISHISERALLIKASQRGLKLGGKALIGLYVSHSTMQQFGRLITLGHGIPSTVRYGLKGIGKIYHTHKSMEASPELPKKTENPQLNDFSYGSLDEVDKKVDEILESLSSLAFEELPKSKEQEEVLLKEFNDQGASSGEKERIAKVNQSLRDYASRPDRIKKKFQLKDKKNKEALWDVYVQLSTLKDKYREDLEKERSVLMAIVNSKANGNPISFTDLIHYLHKGNLAALGPEMGLSADQLQHLEMSLMRHLAQWTRMLQMERILGHYEALVQIDPNENGQAYEDKLERMLDELQVRRGYSFNDLPPRLLRRFIIFETITEKMIWGKQAEATKKALIGNDGDSVIELMMSLGKTYFVIPTMNAFEANGEQIIFNIWPDALAPTNIQQISKQSKAVFNQIANVLSMSRQAGFSYQNVEAINVMLQRALEEGETINMTKSDALAIQLMLLDHLHYHVHNKGHKDGERLKMLSQLKLLLKTIRTRAKAIGDEAHVLFNQPEELNYTIGKSSKIQSSYYKAMEMCMQFMAEDKQWIELVRKNDLSELSDADYNERIVNLDYHERIVPYVAGKIAQAGSLGVKEEQKDEFIAYVSGKTKDLPAWIKASPCFSEIAMVKGVLEILAPLAFSKNIAVRYGKKEGKGEYARPFAGNRNPQETASIRSPYEIVIKTFITYFHEGLDPDQARSVVTKMCQDVLKEVEVRAIAAKETEAYKKLIEMLPGYEFKNFKEPLLDPQIDKEVVTRLKFHSEAILFYVREFVSPNISYWKYNARANGQNFASMFAKGCYDTGTPFNEGVYPPNLKMLRDPGTIGEALNIISKKCPSDGISVLKSSTPEEIADEVLRTHFAPGSDFVAIIDGDALFKGLDNESVARKMLDYCEKSGRKEIVAVAFYKRDKTDGKYHKMVIQSGISQPIPFDKCSVPVDQRLTYYDDNHLFGADIPQKKNGKGLFLLRKITQNKKLQGSFRLRGLKEDKKLFGLSEVADAANGAGSEAVSTQQIYFAMTEKTRNEIVQRRIPGENGEISQEPIPTLDEINDYAIRNEAKEAIEENYLAYHDKIRNVIRSAIFDKMVVDSKSVDEMIEVFKEFESFLISKMEVDPAKLYGLIKSQAETADILKSARRSVFAIIKDSKRFTSEEKKQIKKQLRKLHKPPMPEKVTVYTDGKKVHAGLMDDLDRSVTVEQNAEAENEMENEMQMEVQNEVESHKSRDIPFKETEWSSTVTSEDPTTWLKFVEPERGASSFFGKQMGRLTGLFGQLRSSMQSKLTPPLFRIGDAFRSTDVPELSSVADAFDKRLWFTNNFIPYIVTSISEEPATIGSKKQRDLLEVLIFAEKVDGIWRVKSMGCLSMHDTTIWKEKLSAPKGSENSQTCAMLYDVGERTVVAGDQEAIEHLKKSEDFLALEAQLKFMNGDANYHKDQIPQLEGWLKRCGSEQLKKALSYIRLQRREKTISGTTIDRIFHSKKLTSS